MFPLVLNFLPQKLMVLEVSGARLSSDAGLLPERQFGDSLRFSAMFAEALHKTRNTGGFFNRRRQADPQGEGDPDTWRVRLIKVAAKVIVSARRVVESVSAHWPHLPHLAVLKSQALGLSPD